MTDDSDRIVKAIKELGKGDAIGDMGAVEFLAVKVNEGLEAVAVALDLESHHAEPIRELADAIIETGKRLATALDRIASAMASSRGR